ncbi:MAG: LamG-like jellyroll fold domain-containing protein, partial [Phycisphaeraceae bacterium JB051]
NGTVTATTSSPSYIRVDGTDLGIKFAPGSGDFIECPDDDMLDMHEDQSFTIEMQVRVDASNNDQDTSNWILCKGFPQTDTHGWGVMYNDQTKKIVVNIAGHTFESTSPLLEGWWYHVAIRHIANTGEYDLYINHEKEATLSGYYNGSVTSYPLYIGQGYGWMAPRDFVGAINELRITQTAINPVHFLSWPAPCTSLINKIPVITSLQNTLESQGKLDVYGRMRQTLINKFMTYLAGDYTGQPELAAYGMRDLESIVDSEIARLTVILDNQALPVDSPRRVASQKPVPTNGHLSQQVVWADSTIENDRPVFLFGFHGAGTLSDWSFGLLSSLGCNLSSVELGLHNSMPLQSMWNANDPAASTLDYGFLSYWKTFASDANAHGILTDFMIGPHYIQEWFINNNPQYYVDMGGFLNYAINQPQVHTLVNWTTRLMVDTIKDAPGYWSSCLVNEPEFGKWIGDPDTSDMWLAYLQDKYVTVSILNNTWGTSYASFDQVSEYWTVPAMPFPDDPKLYDWMKFNDERITSWVSDLNDSVYATDSSILTHAKQCDRFLAQSHLLLGSDIDQMCRFTNGLAGHDLATWPKPITGSDLAIEPVWVMMFDSILHQVSGKPIYNSENHLLRDCATNDILPGHVRAAVWLSALSGLDASTAWSWNREPNNPDSLFIGLWQYRPGATEEYLRTGMDLMRVMPSIVALCQTQAKVAVLYSRTSVLRDPNYASVLGNTYQILLESGVNVQAITEQMIENGEVTSKLPDLSLLIIPGATHLSDDVYSGVVSLSQSGVDLVGVGSLVAGKNAYTLPRSNPFSESDVSYTNLAFGDLNTLRWQLIAMLETVGGPQYCLIDTNTSTAASGVIYRTVQLSANEFCATAVNLNRTPVTVRFEKAGTIKTFTDKLNLLPNDATQEITLEPLEVIFGCVEP